MKQLLLVLLMMFLSALCAQEMDWLWVLQSEGTGYIEQTGIGSDANGNTYVTGNFSGSVTFGSTTLTSSGSNDIFVAKADLGGSWLWAVRAGGTEYDSCYDIAVDSNGNVYITGFFYGAATFGTTTLTSSGSDDIFVAKLNSSGTWLWAKRAGETGFDEGRSIELDGSGNVYLGGIFSYSVSFGSTTLTSGGDSDIVVAKLNSSGSWLWARRGGGEDMEGCSEIALDSSGNICVAGYYNGTAVFGSTTLTNLGFYDSFIAKLNPAGNWLWAKRAAGPGTSNMEGVAVDGTGNIYVSGFFTDSITMGATTLICAGYDDICVGKLDSSGNWLWARRAGSDDTTSSDKASAVLADSQGNIYVSGWFSGDLYFGSLNCTNSGEEDMFIAKMTSNGDWVWVRRSYGTGSEMAQSICLDLDENVVWGGMFNDSCTIGDWTLYPSGSFNLMLGKIVHQTPAPPANVQIQMDGLDARISWSPVRQTIYGQDIVPDYYFVYHNNTHEPQGTYSYLDFSPEAVRQYVHQFAADYYPDQFYQISAYKFFADENRSPGWEPALRKYLEETLKPGMNRAEVEDILRQAP